MEKNKEFRNKVLKRLYGIEEEKEKCNPEAKVFGEFVLPVTNQNERIYGAEPPPENYTESVPEVENNESSSDSSQDQIQSFQRRRRRKRKAKMQTKTEEKLISTPSTLTKNQKRKLKKKRRKEKIKEEAEGNLTQEFVYKPSTND